MPWLAFSDNQPWFADFGVGWEKVEMGEGGLGGLREGCQLVGPSEACISCGAVGELSCGGGGGDGSFY